MSCISNQFIPVVGEPLAKLGLSSFSVQKRIQEKYTGDDQQRNKTYVKPTSRPRPNWLHNRGGFEAWFECQYDIPTPQAED